MNSKLSKIFELIKKKQLNDAQRQCLQLLEKENKNHELYNIYAIICYQLEEYETAIKNWKKSIELNPNYFFAYNNIGKAFLNLKKFDEALLNFNKTIDINPNYFEAYNNKGNVLTKLGKEDDAIKNYDRAIEIKPDNIYSYIFKAHILSQVDRLDEALKSYELAYKINSDFPLLLGYILNIKSKICEWENFEYYLKKLSQNLENGKKTSFPFTTLMLLDSPKLQKKASEMWSKGYELSVNKINNFSNINNEKIRIGYFTADFRNHATSHLTAEMFELHDRSKFEIFAFYLGKKINGNDIWHERIKKSFKKFFFVNEMSDLEISQLAIDLKIDIAVDLMTHCNNGMDNRFGVFVRRCAPIQINYLGYPGTSGSKNIDYIIGDKFVIPEESKKYYTEKVIYLPNSYQPNLKKAKTSNKKFTRKDLNLPIDKFVFCSFNQHQKISPQIFNVWMNILKKNPQSVLWLLEDNNSSKKNLVVEAKKKNIANERIIFSERIPIEDHLERIKLADLFLDTYPYSAHTTCSDALRSGLPVLTIMGKSFASRVASSLLKNMDLNELISETFDGYEKLANKLFFDKDYYNQLRNKVKNNSSSSPLYDSKLYTENIEKIFKKLVNNS